MAEIPIARIANSEILFMHKLLKFFDSNSPLYCKAFTLEVEKIIRRKNSFFESIETVSMKLPVREAVPRDAAFGSFLPERISSVFYTSNYSKSSGSLL